MRGVFGVCLGILVACGGRAAQAQEPVIPDTAVRGYVGQSVTVTGRVAAVQRRESGEVWLSLGERYPRARLVVVVSPDLLFEGQWVTTLRGVDVVVQGRILPPTAGSGDRPIVPFIRVEDLGRLREAKPGETPPTRESAFGLRTIL